MDQILELFKVEGAAPALRDPNSQELGLTFCKTVAEAHGGRIYISDNEPTGAVFTLEV